MQLPKFEFHDPVDLAEACEVMAALGASARAIAGGTDLMVNMKKRVISPAHIVSLGRIPDLKSVHRFDGKLRIGACVTVAELAEMPEIREAFGALQSGCRGLGSPLVRNLATIGGNLCSARPAADLPPSLIAYGASVVLRCKDGERSLPLDRFFKGPGLTAIKPDEVLTEIILDDPEPVSGAGYINLGVRKAQDCNIVNVASWLALTERRDAVREARIVLGSVGPTPIRAPKAEAVLVGRPPSESLFEEAGHAAAGDSTPILDFRGSAEYRRAMVSVLTQRTLGIALDRAKAGL